MISRATQTHLAGRVFETPGLYHHTISIIGLNMYF
jgi:hypothetical protein